ncbi:MAG TPA: transcriptional regulator GcvA [Aliidongia sp.]|uniref:transcriptional regulator GcvA n=1 Tax=Aliidongia sp. TaxID=1914230 RepID=UPI002DDD3E11|nr:transcriptional regulator GcvA [Aliidongia sp.]HEV2676607.1 transcriptional regulator GcvA [Aliidongia sp.]
MRNLPPLNALRAFEAAARHLSFTRAADELRVTHGAVSRAVSGLEQWLGSALFRRFNRRIELTDAGSRYLGEIGASLDRIALASERIKGTGARRVLRVNSIATFTIRWLIPRLSSFQQRHPTIEVRLTTSSEPPQHLGETADVIIRGGPDTIMGFQCGLFLDEARLPVLSPSLRARLPLDRPADLARHTLLHTDSLPALWHDWLRLAGVGGLVPAQELTLEHFYLTIQAAVDGLGVAIGPTALVADEIEAGRLMAPFPALSLPARGYCWYLPTDKTIDPAAIAFRDWLVDVGGRQSSGARNFSWHAPQPTRPTAPSSVAVPDRSLR